MSRYERIAAHMAAELQTETIQVVVIVVTRKPQSNRAKRLSPQTIEVTGEEAPPSILRAA
jgi:hypothetical protein